MAKDKPRDRRRYITGRGRNIKISRESRELDKEITRQKEFNQEISESTKLYSELDENVRTLVFNNRDLIDSYKNIIKQNDKITTSTQTSIKKLLTSQMNAIESSKDLISSFETDSKKLNNSININNNLIKKFDDQISNLKEKGFEQEALGLESIKNNIIIINQKLKEFQDILSDTNIGFIIKFEEFAKNIPGIGPLINKFIASPFKEGVSKAIQEGKVGTDALAAGFANIKKVGLQSLFVFLVEESFKVNQQITDLQRNFGLTNSQAITLRSELSEVAALSGDVFINSEKLLKSFTALSQQLGFQVITSGQILETFTNLTQRLGFNEQEATQLTVLSGLQSKNTENVLNNVIKTVNSSRDSNKLFNNTKQILQDVANVSASTIASLGKSPQILGEAATKARELGLNLSQVEKIADSLLNFESSINAELTAELLTGKQLNLERARFLALNNDINGLMKEINKQGLNFVEFSEMNRIAQQAIAETLGMGREELSQMLFNQEKLTLAQKMSRGELQGQTLETFKALSAQEKFNESVSKLKDLFSTLVIAFSPVLDLIALAVEGIALLLSPITWLFSQAGKGIGQGMSSITPTPIQDAYFPSSGGGPIIYDKGELYQGISGDNVAVGTNIPSPFSQINNTSNIQMSNSEIINELKDLKQALVESRSVPVVIENRLDGKILNNNTLNGTRKGYFSTPSVYT